MENSFEGKGQIAKINLMTEKGLIFADYAFKLKGCHGAEIHCRTYTDNTELINKITELMPHILKLEDIYIKGYFTYTMKKENLLLIPMQMEVVRE